MGRLIPANSYPTPSPSFATPLRTDKGLCCASTNAVIEPINKLLVDDTRNFSSSSSNCCGISIDGFLWTPEDKSRIIDAHDMAQYVPVDNSRLLEYLLVHKITNESRCSIELIGSEMFASVGSNDGDLVKAWNDGVYGTGSQDNVYGGWCKRVLHVISRAYTYMCVRGHKYGAITTYDGTWLLCCREDGVLMVSRRYGQSDSTPTPREAIYLWSHLALRPDAVREQWQGQRQPGAMDLAGGAPSPNQWHGSSRRAVELPPYLTANTREPLGSGACGTVCMGRYHKSGSAPIQVAIKAGLAPAVQQLLRYEANIYGRLQPVQGLFVPQLLHHGPGVGDGGYVLAIKLVNGEVLSDNNASQEVAEPALSALRAVHSLGVLHSGLRRANVLVEGSKVWLIDFSHAKAYAGSISKGWEEKLMRDLFEPGWQD